MRISHHVGAVQQCAVEVAMGTVVLDATRRFTALEARGLAALLVTAADELEKQEKRGSTPR